MGCPECGAEQQPGYRFCGDCGARLRDRDPGPAGHDIDVFAVAPSPDEHGLRTEGRGWSGPLRRLAVGVGGLLLLATAVVFVAQDDPVDPATTGHADAARNGVYPPPVGVDLEAIRWRRDQLSGGYGPLGRAVVDDGTAFVTNGAAVVAVAVEDGALEWRAEIHDVAEPAVDRRHVYLRAADRLYTLDRRDGTLVWSEPLGRGALDLADSTAPVVLGDAVVAVGPDGGIRAWEQMGGVRWEIPSDAVIPGGVTVRNVARLVPAGDRVVATVVGSDGIPRALSIDPVDGSTLWTIELDDAPVHGPIPVGGVVVFVAADELVAVELASGTRRWSTEMPLDTAGEALVVAVGGNLAAVTTQGDVLLLDWFDRDRRDLGRWEGATPVTVSPAGHAVGPSSGGLLVHTAEGELARYDLERAQVRWRVPVAAGAAASTLAGRVVITPGQDGSLVGVDALDGTVRWRTPVREDPRCDVSGGADLVYVTTEEGDLNAVRTREGTVLWSMEDTGVVGPVVSDGQELVALDGGVLRFVDPHTGTVEASATAGGGAQAGLVVTVDRVLAAGRNGAGFGSGVGWIRSVDRLTQGSPWLAYVDDWLATPLTLAAGNVIAATESGSVVALDEGSGEERWRHELAAPPAGSAVAADADVFVADLAGHLTALSTTDGSVQWRQALGPPVYGSPVVAGGLVVARSGGSDVVALDASTGRLAWEVALGTEVTSPPSIAGGTIYVGTARGLAMLELRSGDVRDSVALAAPVTAPPVVARDGVIVCLASGSVLALGR